MGGDKEGVIVEQKGRQGAGKEPAEDVAGDHRESPRSLGGWRTWVLVLGVFVIPMLLYAAVAALPMPSAKKVAFSAALVIAAERIFLLPALVLGREAVRRYLNPLTWFGRSRKG